ncbi:HNH endonuclease [Chromobacterium violaceum]|uniref:HNH endonuclease n=1 Tax=Chromobacterium violaceum TaxID=536 RepID=UPI00195044A8|nr:HNH endonuclease signature motif containing protein [Chromobacterium violaceum]QRO33990.1 HNH endonuclease [Chromobacterium violaceum]QRQ16207.1 HNH endonuclease [Chromobacterium violaceum]
MVTTDPSSSLSAGIINSTAAYPFEWSYLILLMKVFIQPPVCKWDLSISEGRSRSLAGKEKPPVNGLAGPRGGSEHKGNYMGIMVQINDFVSYSPSNGVILAAGAQSMEPEEILQSISLAFSCANNKYLEMAAQGGAGPLSKYSSISYHKFVFLVAEATRADQEVEATRAAKQAAIRSRRSAFDSRRDGLVLAMIDSGLPYICAHPDCRSIEDLTIDHIKPLSRGGTDDLVNLQFLCRPCNSAKGARLGGGR